LGRRGYSITHHFPYNPSFGQNTGTQKKLFETYKQNALKKITENNKKLQAKRQKEPVENVTETSGSVRPERIDKWPS
jgi:hypothetical protein